MSNHKNNNKQAPKAYFTRKNLIVISLSIFYSFLLLFVGVCLEGSHTIANAKNPFAMLGSLLGFRSIVCGVQGFICLVLVAIYISVFVLMILYERRYAIVNFKKTYSVKMIITYLVSFLVCVVLSIGLGIIIQKPLDKENILNMLSFVWQSIVVCSIIYIFAFLLIGGIIMFVTNYLLIDKPFKAFEKNKLPLLEDEELNTNDVSVNFDKTVEVQTSTSEASSTVSTMPTETSITRGAEELDTREKVFPTLAKMDLEYEGYSIEQIVSDECTLDKLCINFRNYLAKEEKLYFDLDTIRFFISGLATSHFMILEGLSGTGKSSLPRYFAKFINGNSLFVPVQATWRDKTNLIGFFNDFSRTYSETEFLIELYRANYNPDQIHIFVLDEMNISRVEYYFADFLSVLEYPEDSWKLSIMQLPYDFIPPAKLLNGELKIPNNVYFIGTANKDDSTFTITDKVYDRAITIDFSARNMPFTVEEDVKQVTISKTKLQSLYQEALNNHLNQLTTDDYNKFNLVCDFIDDYFGITFGNRILNQITSFVPVFVACGGKKEDAIDFLLARKVISKLEGRFEEYVKDGLKQLLNKMEKTYGQGVLKQSEKVIKNIMKRL